MNSEGHKQQNSMAPTLYMTNASSPARAVVMTAKAIGLDLNEEIINIFREEQLTSEFLQINPQHTIPTLVDDNGFAIWDSHAIMIYLISKYAKNYSLYPEDFKKRAIINQRLYFDTSVAFFHLKNIEETLFFDFKHTIELRERKGVVDTYDFLEKFLHNQQWVAGDFVSIADYSLVATVSTLNIVVPVYYEKYPNIVTWLKRCEGLPEYEANREGLKEATRAFKARLPKC